MIERDARKVTAAELLTFPGLAAVERSRNKSLAPQSAIIAAREAGVEEGASGAIATPARKAPRKTAAYSIEVAAQIAIASPAPTPSRCKAAATRSMMASSSP